jgi:hypothetical protein
MKGSAQNRRLISAISVLALLVMGAFLWFLFVGQKTNRPGRGGENSLMLTSLSSLLTLSPNQLNQVDIAVMNLLCAQGLPGSEGLDLTKSLEVLDGMAARVRAETERHRYRFLRNPAEFENSEGFFRMIMLAVVLAEDFQVRYAPNKTGTVAEAGLGDGFFADAGDVFLHGLTGAKRQGTCSSLPVLQVAVGRRLGYPLRLVTTRGHLFVRWEDAKERFNIEAAGQAVNRFADDYYRHWPLEVTDAEVQAEGYLKSLTSPEELAVFLAIRGMCWQEAHRSAEAAESFRAASRLAPGCLEYRVMAARLEQALVAPR